MPCRYHCPNCKHDVFEEISVNVTTSFTVINTKEGLDYGKQSSTEGGYVDRFQCASWGYVIKDPDGTPISTLEEVAPVLKKLGAYTNEETMGEP